MPTLSNSIVITGASGFLGKQLVPRLAAAGCTLLLVGRNRATLDQLFPNIQNCTYDMLAISGKGFDTILHLAVLNNTAIAAAEDFRKANVDLLKDILASCKASGIQRFVNFTTFHAVGDHSSDYADSKRTALKMLQNAEGIAVTDIFLPAVYGDDYSGKLAIVKRIPEFLRKPALLALSSLAPTVHIDAVAHAILQGGPIYPRNLMLYAPQDKNPLFRIGKRSVDLLFSAAVIGFVGWLLAIVWVLVRLGSPGPGIFAQERVGKGGKIFTCYKFRTMKLGTKQASTHELSSDVVTKIGTLLRKTKIDELPQVWNILRGEMSLVGPRPNLPIQHTLIEARTRHGVFDVLPGITGLAQIRGIDMSDAERLAVLDAQYIAQRGLIFDIKIIIATFLGRGQGDMVQG